MPSVNNECFQTHPAALALSTPSQTVDEFLLPLSSSAPSPLTAASWRYAASGLFETSICFITPQGRSALGRCTLAPKRAAAGVKCSSRVQHPNSPP